MGAGDENKSIPVHYAAYTMGLIHTQQWTVVFAENEAQLGIGIVVT